MAIFYVTSRQTVFEQTRVEAKSEAEALELAFLNCGDYDWQEIDCSDFEPIEAKLMAGA